MPYKALVLSPRAYNDKPNLMVCCPMTTQIKDYPFEVRERIVLSLRLFEAHNTSITREHSAVPQKSVSILDGIRTVTR